jgi:hypothetical protein
LDGIGIFAGWLFGLSTEGDLNEVRHLVDLTRQKQKEIVHHINEMTTVLNHTFKEIQVNRDRIKRVSRAIYAIIPVVNELILGAQQTANAIKNLATAAEIDRVVITLELAARDFHIAHRNYARKRENLQSGCLTESLLPPKQLIEFLKLATTLQLRPIQPLYWYYRYCLVTSVQGGVTLVYKVTLPMIEPRNFVDIP